MVFYSINDHNRTWSDTFRNQPNPICWSYRVVEFVYWMDKWIILKAIFLYVSCCYEWGVCFQMMGNLGSFTCSSLLGNIKPTFLELIGHNKVYDKLKQTVICIFIRRVVSQNTQQILELKKIQKKILNYPFECFWLLNTMPDRFNTL